jgi:hypothetical protein
MSLVETYVASICLVGLSGVLLGLLGLPSRAGRRPLVRTAARLAVALAVGGGAAAAFALGHPRGVWVSPAALAVGALALETIRSPAAARALLGAVGLIARPRCQAALLLLAGPALALWLAYHLEESANAASPDAAFVTEAVSLPMEEVPGVYAVTDAGQPVRVYRLTDEALACPARADGEAAALQMPHVRERFIRTAPYDPRYNCHGWVLTGGRYWVKCQDMAAILQENGYEPVASPRAADLVVYRDAKGMVTHSAVVRVAGSDTPVLVESKWGRAGRFIHPVDAHGYGGDYQYYRSPRPGHLLAGLGGETPSPSPEPDRLGG